MHRNHDDPAGGFTLVDVLVAVSLLALLVAGVASLTSLAARALIRSRLDTMAVLLAQERLEQLRSLAWGYGSAHAPLPGEDRDTDLSAAEPRPGGHGLASSPASALDADTAGYVDYLDQAGRWLAAGVSPPAGARFVRRWSVERPAARPGVVVLRVRVIDRRADIASVDVSTARARTAA